MSDLHEKFKHSWVSFHPGKYDWYKARTEQGYGRYWARGYRTRFLGKIDVLAEIVRLHVWSPIVYKLGHRHGKNFHGSEWIALDFDSGDLTLNQAIDRYQDCVHVIGTTKSHQKRKNDKPACDRFRVVLRLSHPVRCAESYAFTFAHYVNQSEADSAVKDAARFLYPCEKIVSVNGEGYTQEVQKPHEKPTESRIIKYKEQLPRWVDDFLVYGKLPRTGSRNWAFFAAARELLDRDFDTAKITAMFIRARDKHGWSDIENGDLERRILSAMEVSR